MDNLVGLRELTQAQAKLAVQPVSAISGGQSQTDQTPEDDGSSVFETLLDTLNPLQHIPGVSSAYQAVTGDTSSAVAEMAGGFLFGGPMGLAAGAASSFLEMLTGKSFSEHAMAFFGGAEDAEDPATTAGLNEIQTADGKSLESLIQPTADPLGIEQYQAFAAAHSDQHLGIGADARDVSWASNMWTDSALQKAAGLYETNQSLGEQQRKSVQTLV
ncbi:hypothetical protein BEN30_01575 [Magnetovibrio blakemorei]|uniref:Uncharacterized protein n=2 Tax=Magnetovibrio blakemorei TaxID=28181 RepID=A0A1E5Q3P8_9PROT|nr:hypothetical protein BEN30_01575 [Magnetovibrio blakemorei]